MTARFCVAMFYGISAALLSICLQARPAEATQPLAPQMDTISLSEIEPDLTGHAEIDDLPEYLAQHSVRRLPDSHPAASALARRPAQMLVASAPPARIWSVVAALGLVGLALTAWILRRWRR